MTPSQRVSAVFIEQFEVLANNARRSAVAQN